MNQNHLVVVVVVVMLCCNKCVCVLVSSNSGSYMTKGFTNAKNGKILYQSEDGNGWEKMRKTRKELPSASNANINGNGG